MVTLGTSGVFPEGTHGKTFWGFPERTWRFLEDTPGLRKLTLGELNKWEFRVRAHREFQKELLEHILPKIPWDIPPGIPAEFSPEIIPEIPSWIPILDSFFFLKISSKFFHWFEKRFLSENYTWIALEVPPWISTEISTGFFLVILPASNPEISADNSSEIPSEILPEVFQYIFQIFLQRTFIWKIFKNSSRNSCKYFYRNYFRDSFLKPSQNLEFSLIIPPDIFLEFFTKCLQWSLH